MKILKRIYYLLDFIIFYFWKLVKANLFIAYDIITPRMHTRPGFIEIPLGLTTDLGLLLFSNLLSMTPGSLSIDVQPDRKNLLIHVLYKDNEAAIIAEIMKVQEKIKAMVE